MNKDLITTAFQLYVETVPLENMSVDHPEFHDLYSKECQLFDLLRKMDWEESEEYRHQVRIYNIEHGISNKVSWSDEDQNDSLGLEDLLEYDHMYYVGDIADVDGDGWVNEDDASKILEELNEEDKK